METRFLRILATGLVLVGLLAGCATTASRLEVSGLPTSEHSDYLAHPLRMISLGFYFAGNVTQYVAVEPFFFLMNTGPEVVGLSLEERRYLEQRQEAWRQYLSGERGPVE